VTSLVEQNGFHAHVMGYLLSAAGEDVRVAVLLDEALQSAAKYYRVPNYLLGGVGGYLVERADLLATGQAVPSDQE
jgi:hypothetical protein